MEGKMPMLIIMNPAATEAEINRVVAKVHTLGLKPHKIPGTQRVAIGITGNEGHINPDHFSYLDGVAEVISVSKPYKLVSREMKPEDTKVVIGDGKITIGGDIFGVIAGPCAVEGREQIIEIAKLVKSAGAHMLRGGAFKPRTSPYSFQGLKEDGLKFLAEARDITGLPVVTEVKDTESLELVAKYADVLQIGARNMQNFSLLEAAGLTNKPILLKRGMSATIQELLMSAEYLLNQGNYQVMLCERGIRTFETMTRNTLDIGAIPVLKRLTHLPIVVDPSHAIGIWYGVPALARAALSAGADGLIIEVHQEPEKALSDGYQSLRPDRFAHLMHELREIAKVIGKKISL
jgi:3-deoxy-7-phosphoheptulonate synthase